MCTLFCISRATRVHCLRLNHSVNLINFDEEDTVDCTHFASRGYFYLNFGVEYPFKKQNLKNFKA